MSRTSRRFIITCLVAVLLSLTVSSAMAATGTVTAASVVLRESMSTASDAVVTLRKGDEVDVISKQGSWYKVKDGSKVGYVMTRYIKVDGTVEEENGTLQEGSRGETVKKLQQRLVELGYLDGKCDGIFGEKTTEAVKAFQKRNGLTADGLAGEATQKKLYSSSAKKAAVTASNSKDDDDNETTTTLRPGATGAEVKKLQSRLRALGYFDHAVDGKYDDQVTEAVKAFQQRNKLTADGIAGPSTLTKLNSSSAKPAAGTETDEDGEESATLRPGATGAAVKTVQNRLRTMGYFDHAVDGKYDSQLTEAVKAFQKRNGLTADGIVGPTTLARLNSSSAKPAEDQKQEGEETATLRPGATGAEVKEVQNRLRTLGYFDHAVDGKYDNQVTEAVKAFQKRNGLTADGIVGPATLKKLNSSSARPAEEKEAEDEDLTLNTKESMKIGDRSDNVKAMQLRLKELGYLTGSCTGYYGTATREAVKDFQKNNNLSVDGLAGTATLRKLASTSAKANGSSSAPVVDTLKPGATGSAVKALQTRLRELGYFDHSLDGKYDDQVTEAVKAFQKRNGLSADGLAGALTLAKLNSSSAKAAEDTKDDASEEDKSDDVTLRLGATGSKVKELQTRLRELGYFDHALDGKYDSQVVEGVKAFQKRNGLTADGVAGKSTQTKLFSSSAKAAEDAKDDEADEDNKDETLRPGDSGSEVKELQTRLRELGYFNHSLDGKYDSQVTEAVKAFQKRNGLTADGIAGKTTQAKLYSSSAKKAEDAEDDKDDDDAGDSTKYKTERLDWFNGGASVIPRRAVFSVKDVKTGLVFRAKRQAGYNHLDAEPLTAADTAILLKINGGQEFSWRRRPMLVLYNGHVYACSIYSEPHGTDTIANNNYDGQFCLHFYGSMTHGTTRVDEDHARCERQALSATW